MCKPSVGFSHPVRVFFPLTATPSPFAAAINSTAASSAISLPLRSLENPAAHFISNGLPYLSTDFGRNLELAPPIRLLLASAWACLVSGALRQNVMWIVPPVLSWILSWLRRKYEKWLTFAFHIMLFYKLLLNYRISISFGSGAITLFLGFLFLMGMIKNKIVN